MTSPSRIANDSQSRGDAKRRAILRAAATVFLRNGYVGTSVDEIAALAAVSKQTVYKHFADKQRLFCELVTRTIQEASDRVHHDVLSLDETGTLEDDLRALARSQLANVMQPEVLQLRRLVIGEATRFPQLGRAFYQLGPGRTIETLVTVFTQLAERGLLRLEDPALAAEHFNWLVMSIPLNRAMLLGDDQPLGPGDLDRYADAGVTVFLAAYGKPRNSRH